MIYKLVTRTIQYFCFPNRPMKGGGILDFQKGANLKKGGLIQKRGGMTSLTNYDSIDQKNHVNISAAPIENSKCEKPLGAKIDSKLI